jgi:hypothetical protein
MEKVQVGFGAEKELWEQVQLKVFKLKKKKGEYINDLMREDLKKDGYIKE